MSIWSAFAFVLVATVALAVVVATLGLRPWRRRGERGIRRMRRMMTLSRVVAMVLAVWVVLDVVTTGSFGQGLALAPIVAATVWMIGGVTAEILSRSMLRDGGANLEVRTVRQYLPRLGSVLLVLAVVALVVTGVITGLLADASGRGLTHSCGPGCTGTRTPWPGSFYLLPMGVAFAVLIVLTALSIRLAATRPRGGLTPAQTAEDDRVRRSRVAGALAVVALTVALTGTGLLLFGMLPSLSGPGRPDGVVTAAGSVLVAIVLAVAALATVLRVVRDLPARESGTARTSAATKG